VYFEYFSPSLPTSPPLRARKGDCTTRGPPSSVTEVFCQDFTSSKFARTRLVDPADHLVGLGCRPCSSRLETFSAAWIITRSSSGLQAEPQFAPTTRPTTHPQDKPTWAGYPSPSSRRLTATSEVTRPPPPPSFEDWLSTPGLDRMGRPKRVGSMDCITGHYSCGSGLPWIGLSATPQDQQDLVDGFPHPSFFTRTCVLIVNHTISDRRHSRHTTSPSTRAGADLNGSAIDVNAYVDRSGRNDRFVHSRRHCRRACCKRAPRA